MLTPKQKKFADEYLETGNGTKAALKAYDIKAEDKENVAAAMGSENLTKPKVKEYLESQTEAVAINMVRLALNAQKESDQISAGKDVLDRGGLKPTDKTDTTVKIITATEDETIEGADTDSEG